MYLFETFERYGVELALEKLGVEGVHVGFEARYVDLSAVLSLHFVPEMKERSGTQPISFTGARNEGWTEDPQFFRSEEPAFKYVVPNLAASYAVDVLLRLWASVRVRSRRKRVGVPLLANDPTRFGARFALAWAGGRYSEIGRTIDGHWALDLGLRQGRKPWSRRGLESIG